jgi:hypothetical protein
MARTEFAVATDQEPSCLTRPGQPTSWKWRSLPGSVPPSNHRRAPLTKPLSSDGSCGTSDSEGGHHAAQEVRG